MPVDEFRPDCESCSGLCCVALPFTRSQDFGADKESGVPCRHLADDFRCAIHERLDSAGWPGCMVFDCFGAGQLTTQHVFEGMTWRNTPSRAPQIFEVFLALRVVQEVRYHLAVTVWQNLPPALSARLAALQASADALVDSSPAELTQQAAHSLRAQASPVFREVSAALRPPAHLPSRLARRVRPRADLLGADLSGLDLTGVDLHGSLLIASDLSQARLHLTDLLGADLRDADLGGADLRTALFLTQPQVNAAQGNADTLLPVHLTAPSKWTVAP